MHKKPLKATDRRRNTRAHGVKTPESGATGMGAPLANLFTDRRKHANGKGKKAF